MIRSYLPKTPQRSSLSLSLARSAAEIMNFRCDGHPGHEIAIQPVPQSGHQTALPALSETYHDPTFI